MLFRSLFIIGSYRIEERPSLPEELPEMSHLLLPRLTPEALSDLCAAMLGETGRSEAIQTLLQRESEGNAFFAVEVVRALAEKAGRLGDIGQISLPQHVFPDGIRTILDQRLQQLPDAALPPLQLAAVAGREIDERLIQATAGDLEVESWWLPLCSNAAIIEVQDGRWHFNQIGRAHV